jgi:murein DD-endopeptidase MepM/ murein hydrolase activator NlpD
MSKVVRLCAFAVALSPLFLLFPERASAVWFYPTDKYYERQTVKGFGEYIDGNFYKGKETLFPYNRFYGYHAAVDLEIFPGEMNTKVPVYAASSGTITYIGTLSGYGGVILEKPDNENNTVLYGHVKIENLSIKVGDRVETNSNPVILTYLGDQFSAETSKERKHLHVGIYKGIDLYFVGHEPSLDKLQSRWIDPNIFLKAKNAVDPVAKPSPAIPISNTVNNTLDRKSILSFLLDLLKQLLSRL